MLVLEELEKKVMALPKSKYSAFRKWFLEQDFENWDREIQQDSETGKLDFLVQEAQSEMKSGKLKNVPAGFRDEVFLRFFKAAEVAKLKPNERQAYEQSLKYYRDMKNVISTAVEEEKEALREEMISALNAERCQREASQLREAEERRQKEESQLREASAQKRIAELEALLRK